MKKKENKILGRKLVFGDENQIQALKALSGGNTEIEHSIWSEERPVTEYRYYDFLKFKCVVCQLEDTANWETGSKEGRDVEITCIRCKTVYTYDTNEEILTIKPQ